MPSDKPAAARELERLLERVPTVLAYWDATLRCQFCNQAAVLWSGVPPESAIGKHASELLGPLYHVNLPYMERVLRGEPQRFERDIPDPHGGPARSGLINYTPDIVDGEVRGFFVLVTDISDLVAARKAAEEVAQQLRESDRHKDGLLARARELAESLATVREDERRAVAVSLHEGVAQDLYAAQLSLRELKRKGHLHAGIKEIAEELSQIINQSIEHVRNLTNDLYPTSLVHLSLSKALEQLGRDFGRRSGVQVVVDQLTDFPELKIESRVLFFRAAQEALANVARHADASTVNITLEADTERIAMLVADDGKGIAADDLNKIGSLGLLGMRERFAAAGGGLTVERRASCGTCLTVFLPSRETDFMTAASRAIRGAPLTKTKGRRA